jgi:sec-independent protein translocase protein TatC
MAVAAARLGHEDRVSVVEHLDELRTRLIVSIVAVALAFGFCLWQNHALLRLANAPLVHQTRKQVQAGHGPLGATYTVQVQTRTVAEQVRIVVKALGRPGSGVDAATRAALSSVTPTLDGAVRKLDALPEGDRPVTLGIGEPFTTTLGISFLFALILAMPVVLYQLYAFLVPALAPEHRRATRPLLLAVPFLFVAGVLFGYEVVLPAAVRFFQNFNSEQFNVLVQASQYYHFAAVTLLAMGLVFQIPVAIVGATSAGLVTPQVLKRNRRYALLACALVAAFLPGDAVTLVLETAPLYLLFELSVLLAWGLQWRARTGSPS